MRSPPRSHSDHNPTIHAAVPAAKCEIIAHMKPIKLTKDIPVPRLKINLSGFMLNDVMPSTANETIFFSGYLDSPAKRSCLS